MSWKDTIKYLLARITFRKIILFSHHTGREWNIKKRKKGFVPFFYDFDKVNLGLFKIVVPLTLQAQKYINANKSKFINKVCLSPSDDCIDLADNKEKFHSYLSANGFRQYTPGVNEKFGYPYVIKSKIGDTGKGVTIVMDENMEKEVIKNTNSDDYYTMEYLEGKEEYAAQIIFARNRIVFFRTLQYSFSEEYNVKGHQCMPDSVDVVNHDEYKPVFEGILNSMNYQGFACFDYKVTGDGLKIIELNPRYGGWMDTFINEALDAYCYYG